MMQHNQQTQSTYQSVPNLNMANAKELSKQQMSKMMVIDDIDREVWEIVTNVPKVSMPVAVGQMVVNLVLPGFGTWITACASKENVSKTQLIIGFLQFVTSVVLIGWIWAIYWSFLTI